MSRDIDILKIIRNKNLCMNAFCNEINKTYLCTDNNE